MVDITLSGDLCTRCRGCEKICPADIFRWDGDSRSIYVHKAERCIECGHCVAVCGAGAISHSDFSDDKVHPIDRELLPSAEQVMLLLRSRRSNRALTQKPVPAEYLDGILEACHRAPTASNLQMVEYTLITDPAKLRVVMEFTMKVYGGMLRMVDNPIIRPLVRLFKPDLLRYIPIFKKMQREYASGRDVILRGATSLILIHTDRACRFGSEDSNLAYQNGSLYAEALGVSQIYTGFVLTAIKSKKGQLEKQLGIKGTIHAGMALGMPSHRVGNYIDKKPLSVSKL